MQSGKKQHVSANWPKEKKKKNIQIKTHGNKKAQTTKTPKKQNEKDTQILKFIQLDYIVKSSSTTTATITGFCH